MNSKVESRIENIFFSLLFLQIIAYVFFFKAIVLTANFNFIVILINSILLAIVPELPNRIMKNEVYKLIIIGFNFLFFDILFDENKWVEILLFNFYSLMYSLLFYIHIRRLDFLKGILLGYFYVINSFLVCYFLVLNAELIVETFFSNHYLVQIQYMNIGIKVIILFISLLTFFHFVIARVKWMQTSKIKD
ncbi:hypothetical protein [Myroides odoratus]|uniref:hypothetical protein n=1 Tax=Myroides odoratus TaxID=256 RepID=UPI0039AF6B22